MHLTLKYSNNISQVVDLEGKDEFILGRDNSCDVRLHEPMASRIHARLVQKGGYVFIEDLGSRHGIFLNDVKVTEQTQFSEYDTLRIGSTLLFLSEKSQLHHVEADNILMDDEFEYTSDLYTDSVMDVKRRMHEAVLREMNLSNIRRSDLQQKTFQTNLETALQKVLRDFWHEIPRSIPGNVFHDALIDDLIYFGPISPLVRSDEINEIMVNGPDKISIEKKGLIYRTGIRFINEQHLMTIIQRIVEQVGRHIDEVSPMVDARLEDGSRVNAIIPPLSLVGPTLTIRKFAKKRLTTEDLINYGSLSPNIATFLREVVRLRRNILVTGGTGTGKTTMLNVLSNFIPINERLITIEDSAELRLHHWNLVRLEARIPNVEGKGRITIRDLVVNSLRMRPDRIIVGECRSGEAWDMLQAMNTGHEGSLTTIHANSPRDALSRLENMVLMSGFELPVPAIREQISSAINIIVHISRLPNGSRKITKISEITGHESDVITMQDIFEFKVDGASKDGSTGSFVPTGNIPAFIQNSRKLGLSDIDLSIFSQVN